MKANRGTKVKVEFVGQLEEGTVFGKARAESPLEFTLGEEGVIPGFEEALLGMEPGERKSVQVPPEKAFGRHDPTKIRTLERHRFPEAEPLRAGMKVNVLEEKGAKVPARVQSISDGSITLDLNHPLAGQTLNFKIHMLEVASA